MQWNLLLSVLPTATALGFLLLIVAIITAKDRRKGYRDRRHPLTRGLLRGPGHSVQRELEKVQDKIMDTFLFAFITPFLFTATLVLSASANPSASLVGQIILIGLLLTGGLVYFVLRFSRLFTQRRHLRLGLDGEMAVGQELNNLMRNGFKVFHDIPAEGFNIDHVAVGPTGVFAIETKARPKPTNIEQGHRVAFDGNCLRFPGWTEKKPLEQASRQAQWLSKWLTSAVGEKVGAVSVLALPGWFVERVGKSGTLVYNGARSDTVFPKYRGRSLDESMVQRISHQLDQRCRDVEPAGK